MKNIQVGEEDLKQLEEYKEEQKENVEGQLKQENYEMQNNQFLLTCDTCRQIVNSFEYSEHMEQHENQVDVGKSIILMSNEIKNKDNVDKQQFSQAIKNVIQQGKQQKKIPVKQQWRNNWPVQSQQKPGQSKNNTSRNSSQKKLNNKHQLQKVQINNQSNPHKNQQNYNYNQQKNNINSMNNKNPQKQIPVYKQVQKKQVKSTQINQNVQKQKKNEIASNIENLIVEQKLMNIDIDQMTSEQIYEYFTNLDMTIKKGYSEEQIEKMKIIQFQQQFNFQEDDPIECQICKEEFQPNQDCLEFSCGHFYHYECAHEWLLLQKFCPLCHEIVQIYEYQSQN